MKRSRIKFFTRGNVYAEFQPTIEKTKNIQMKLFRSIANNERQILLRNRFQLLVLSLFVLIGIYSIYYGHTEITRQSERIIQVEDSISNAQMACRKLRPIFCHDLPDAIIDHWLMPRCTLL